MRLRALIFDVDGTLADTEEAHRQAFNAAFQDRGLEWRWSVPQYARLLSITGGKERLRAYIDSLPLWPTERRSLVARIPDIHAAKTALYTRSLERGSVQLREGIERLLQAAEDAGIRLAIASTTTRANIEALLRATLGAASMRRFAAVAAGDDVPRKKPSPDVYRCVLRALDLPAADCVAVEDSAVGLQAAKAAGLYTVVTPSQWTKDEDFAQADWIVPSFAACERPLKEIESRGQSGEP
jgi:HAD superfamily hydrolase (TIGR01509 family)